MEKLISIIVPVYGTEKYLDKCIRSITEQSYKNLEIILVDDESPDNCPEICDDWAKKDSRIKVIHKKNGGVSSARNAGLDAVCGEYIGFVDSDDWIEPELYKTAIDIFNKHNPDIVSFNVQRVDENGNVYTTTEKIKEGLLTKEQAIEELLKGNINNYAVNKICKREVYKNIRYPDGRVFEDMATAYKIFMNIHTIYCYPVVFYSYFKRSGSISKSINEKTLADIFLARYECHMTMKKFYPSFQKYTLPLVAIQARRLYDRSLWKSVDDKTLSLAKEFLLQNKTDILNSSDDKTYILYYRFPHLYYFARMLRHIIGNVVKKFK